MSIFQAITFSAAGIFLVVFFSGKLVRGLSGTAIHFKTPAFLLSVIFLGFDPENLGVGAIGSYESFNGIATGSIIGAAMVAMALALGISALFAPLKFKKPPKRIMLIPFLSVMLFSVLILDKHLSRYDGLILLAGYCISIIYLIKLNRKGYNIKAGGEISESLEKKNLPGRWRSAGLMIISLAAIIGGSEMLVRGSGTILKELDLSDTVYGMTILALLISSEEIARELPAALKGKSDITIGNVIGSVIAFFLFNAGLIALVSPVDIPDKVIGFFLPASIITVIFIIAVMLLKRGIPRWAGVLLIIFYLVFAITGYFL